MKPDFICIGPEKTATTWLFRVLETHPDVWLPPYKELRFLNEGNTVPEHSLSTLFFSSHWHYKELRRILLRSTVKLLLGRKTSDFSAWQAYRWVLYYMFRKHTFAWYDGLFDHESGKLTGDVTPNYYDIPESRIQQLSQSHPDVKILLFVRNPIARAWSKALMLGCNHAGRAFEDVSEDEWITVLDAIYREWTAYPEVIDRWKKYFPDMHIAYFDQLQDNPDAFMHDVTTYLGLSKPQSEKVNKLVGKGVGKAMPEKVSAHLQQQYAEEIQAIIAMGEATYPSGWVKD